MCDHFKSEFFAEGPEDAAVARDAARHEHGLDNTEAPREGSRPDGHGPVYPRKKIADIDALRQARDDLRLGEHGAGGGYVDAPLRQSVQAPHLVQPEFEYPCHDLKKTPRARGALVVHHKVHEPAVFGQRKHLAVLAADIDDGTYSRAQESRTF
jgi:hypothetical protein